MFARKYAASAAALEVKMDSHVFGARRAFPHRPEPAPGSGQVTAKLLLSPVFALLTNRRLTLLKLCSPEVDASFRAFVTSQQPGWRQAGINYYTQICNFESPAKPASH